MIREGTPPSRQIHRFQAFLVAHSPAAIDYARKLRADGESLAAIAKKTGIPKGSVWRYLAADEAK